MTGYDELAIKNMGVADLHCEEDLPRVFDLFEKMKREEIELAEDICVRRKDGTVFSADINSSNVVLGGKLFITANFRDKTARKNYEAEIIEAREKAEAANKAKSLFLANMSHELRTPMNGIIGFTDILAMSGLNEEQREFNEMVKISSGHLLDIINDILDFSKIEAKKLKLDKKPFNICETVKNSKILVDAQIKQKRLKLYFEIDAFIKERLLGDQLKFRQILLNILTNAVKFTPSGKKIVIRLLQISEEGASCRINLSVIDEGIGIARDKIGEVFEMFHQLDGSFTKKYGGTGLGLSITRGLVELMGGTISVKSELGKGSEFIVELPFEIDLSVSAREGSSPSAEKLKFHGNGREIRVLVAEDDEVSCELIKTLAKHFKWKVEIVTDGKEALRLYMEQGFDVVIMDGQMPEMNGFEAAGLIREIEKVNGVRRVPIVALTAYALEGDREKFIEAGMDGYVTKPIGDGAALYEAVMKLVKN